MKLKEPETGRNHGVQTEPMIQSHLFCFGGIFFFFAPSGFAELQTDMTDLTKELNRSQGIPFLEYKQFVTRTFFPKVRNPIYSLLSDFDWHIDNTIFLTGVLIFLPCMSHFPFVTACNMQGKNSPWNF